MTVVVGFVPTAEGRAAVDAAIAEARLRGAKLVAVNSSRGDAVVDGSYAQQQDMQELRRRLEESGVGYEVRQYVRGHDGAEEVLELAEELDAQLIVIGLRRRSPVGKLFLGSVSQRILLGANCPVLGVKAED